MSWLTKIFCKEDDWRFVKQLDTTFVSTSTELVGGRVERNEKKHNINYYLHENQDGERKFDVADSKRGDCNVKKLEKDDIAFRLRMYRQQVKPWLDGAYDPEIPSYESIKAKEFKDNLAGKVT